MSAPVFCFVSQVNGWKGFRGWVNTGEYGGILIEILPVSRGLGKMDVGLLGGFVVHDVGDYV